MSITDGHILFRQNLANKGVQPPIDSGYSVSRIAGRAQTPVMRELSDRFKQLMIRFTEVEKYLAFGTELQDDAQKTIDLGRRAQDLCNQQYEETYLPHQQFMLLHLLVSERALYWDRAQMIMLRIQLFTFIESSPWKEKLQAAATADGYDTALPMVEEVLNAFVPAADTIKPMEKKKTTSAEKETIIDLLRDSSGVQNAA